MSNMEAGGSAAALKALDDASRPETGALTKHGRHGRSGGGGHWATIQKAAKEPTYKGPWVSESGEKRAWRRNNTENILSLVVLSTTIQVAAFLRDCCL